MSNFNEIEGMDVTKFLGVFFRRKLLFFSIFLITVAGALIFYYITPKIYNVKVVFDGAKVWNKTIESPYFIQDLVESDAFVAQVKQNVNSPLIVEKLKKQIKVEVIETGTPPNRVVLYPEINVKDTDIDNAMKIVNAIVEILKKRQDVYYNEMIIPLIQYQKEFEEQITHVKNEISELEQLLKKIRTNPNVDAPQVLLLQSQLEQKQTQLKNFLDEYKDVLVKNTAYKNSHKARALMPPYRPEKQTFPRLSVCIIFGFFGGIVIALFLTYILDFVWVNKEKIMKG